MRPRFVLAAAIAAVLVVGCGGQARTHGHSASSTLTTSAVVVVPAAVGQRCQLGSVFEALAELAGGSVVCPTWLPSGLRASALTVGSGGDPGSYLVTLTSRRRRVTVQPGSAASPPGAVVERVVLSDGPRVVVAAAGRGLVLIVSHIPGAVGQSPLAIALSSSHVTRSSALTTARRLVRSLRVLPSDIIDRQPPCQYPAVFAAVALVAGADVALCPRWLPANVSLDLAAAGPLEQYNPVEFHGAQSSLPHIVFEWALQATPGRPIASMTLVSGRRVPIYFQPPGVGLNSDHLIAVGSPASAHPRFWVSLHDSYGSQQATETMLRRIVSQLRPLDPRSGRPRP